MYLVTTGLSLILLLRSQGTKEKKSPIYGKNKSYISFAIRRVKRKEESSDFSKKWKCFDPRSPRKS